MAGERLDLGKVSFEDVLLGEPRTPLTPTEPKVEVTEPVEPKIEPKVEPKVETPKEDEPGLIEALGKLIGYDVEGEYEESVEGIAEYTKNVALRIAEEEVKDLFENFPDVKEYLQFRLNNGDPAKYFESKFGDVDYSKYQVDERDETTQEVIVRKYLANQGYNEEEVNETIKDYKDTNLLYKTAKKASEKLIESQRSRKDEIITKQAESARKAEVEREEVVAEITDTVEKGRLHNLVIPEKDKKEFKQWLLNADQRGRTKRQDALSKMSIEQKLELEYLVFKGFDLKDLVRKESTQTRIDLLKKGNSKTSRLGGTGKEEPSKKNSLTGIKFDDLL